MDEVSMVISLLSKVHVRFRKLIKNVWMKQPKFFPSINTQKNYFP